MISVSSPAGRPGHSRAAHWWLTVSIHVRAPEHSLASLLAFHTSHRLPRFSPTREFHLLQRGPFPPPPHLGQAKSSQSLPSNLSVMPSGLKCAHPSCIISSLLKPQIPILGGPLASSWSKCLYLVKSRVTPYSKEPYYSSGVREYRYFVCSFSSRVEGEISAVDISGGGCRSLIATILFQVIWGTWWKI